jgi:predicted outer membrane repeat protein
MKKYLLILSIFILSANFIFAQNRALDFNGSDESVDCGTFNLGDDPTDNSFTYECWFKVDAFGSLTNLVGFEVNGSNTALLRINGTKLEFLWAEAGYSYYVVAGATTLETDVWYHAAGVFDDNGAGAATAYIYLNGVQDGYATGMSATVSANSTFYIGGSGGRYLNGQMDEVRVWKGVARTQTEVQDNMYNELDGTETGLFAYYKLNETTGTTAYDAQVSGTYDGTLVNCTFDDNSTRGVIIYVDADVSGSDGATWATAYSSLQDALTNAFSGNEIWVAKGTYYPSVEVGGTGTRFQTFQMINDVKIYGGFAGTETSVADRQIGTNETILSGDIGTVDDNADNCYHVIYNSQSLALNNTAILDGFTITGGNANNTSEVTKWLGGGMLNYSSSPTVKNCYFIDNSALDGGALTNYTSSSPKIINCAFVENQSNRYGGGIYNYSNCSPTVTNCTFTNNSANDKGGAIRNFNSSNPVIKNSIFWSNSAINGENEISNITNSVPVISYSNIEGSKPSGVWDTNLGTDGGNNIDANPIFAGSQNASHPYSLTGISPCADAGLDAANSETYDIRGSSYPRILNKDDGSTTGTDIIDMGAYEYKFGTDPAGVTYYVSSTGNNSDGFSWANAFTSFQSALNAAVSGCEIWVAKGTYKPSSAYDLTDTERYYHFRMINGVEIYGGFAGTETATSQRTDYGDGGVNETILSGDIGTVDDNSDNCYHVFYHPDGTNLNNTAILDGFTITKGYGDGTIPYNWGSGMYNYGSSQKIVNCTFTDNFSSNSGGAVANNESSSPELYNCVFINNESTTYGGAFYNKTLSSPTIVNCTFTNNNSNYGGAIANNATNATYACTPTIINSIFWGNTASSGNEIYNNNSTPAISYCDIEGSGGSSSWDANLGTNDGNNIDSDPLFYDAGNVDYRITQSSPCVEAGDDNANSETTDIRGGGRKLLSTDYTQVGTIDMGAYEHNTNTDPASPTPVELVSFYYEIVEGTSTNSTAILLKWETATEINNYGFEIEKSVASSQISEKEWKVLSFTEGHGNSNSPKYYEYLDETPIVDSVEYRLKQIDTDGAFTYYAQTLTVSEFGVTGVENVIPKEFSLSQNYPNPFNPSTTIKYGLKTDSNVRLTIYNIIGQEVATLVNQKQQAGNYSVNFDASNLASGAYIYRISATSTGSVTDFVSVKKLLIMK